MASIQIFRFLLNWLKHLKSYKGINSENIVFFPENYLRHIDSGDISLVNGKTEGIDGMMKTTSPLLHDFLFLFSECLICFALKHCSGMNDICMIRCSSQINVLTCPTVSHSLVKVFFFQHCQGTQRERDLLLKLFKRFRALIDLLKLQFFTF